MRIQVALRLCFVKLPNLSEERIFRASLEFTDPESCSYQDLAAIIENKLIFMEIHNVMDTVTVFFKETNGDRVVVDDCYFALLVRQWTKAATRKGARSCSSESGSGDKEPHTVSVSASFEIEVTKSSSQLNLSSSTPPQPTALSSSSQQRSDGGARMARPAKESAPLPLTIENLAKLPIASMPVGAAPGVMGLAQEAKGSLHAVTAPLSSSAPPPHAVRETLIRIGELTCPPRYSPFFVRCVILAIRFKTPKPGLTVAELDLGDREAPTAERITAVTFDEQVQRAIRQNLRSDLRQVVEIRNCLVRGKSEMEKRFQTNPHPLQLRLDKSCNIEVVQLLAAPLVLQPDKPSAIVTVRDQTHAVGVLDLSDMASLGRPRDGAVAGSSSSSSGPVRTVFSLTGGALRPKVALPLAAAPPQSAALLGLQLQHQQQSIIGATRAVEAAPHEHGLPYVTAQDLKRREPLIEHQANRAEIQKERIRHRSELSMECFLCGLNVESESLCMDRLRYMLSRNTRRAGVPVPTFEELREALCDQRRDAKTEGGKRRPKARLYCETHFVNTSTRTLHVVHPRCAHLCTDYQEGKPMEDIAGFRLAMNICALCGGEGACVRCYHPDCNEQYHIPCALFSKGYVNFGKTDPYRPCPACPRHTLVSIDNDHILGADGDAPRRGKNENLWAEDIVFDSNVVEDMDLRDPDEHNDY